MIRTLIALAALLLCPPAHAGQFSALITSSFLATHPSPQPTPTPAPSNVCDNCNGTGKLGDGTISITCPVCNGKGTVTSDDLAAKDARLLEAWRQYGADMREYFAKQKTGCGCRAAGCPANCPCGANCPLSKPAVKPVTVAPVVQAPAVVRLPGPSWVNHDGDLATHLQRVHGVNTVGLMPAQLRTVHSNLHNTGQTGIRRYATPVILSPGCPGGRCPR